jgi:diguanylate cyclase (GGDEF)-like protein
MSVNLASCMLHDLLMTNRALLIDRCLAMVASRSSPKLTRPELAHGIPIFLDQVAKTLAIEQQTPFVGDEIVLRNSTGFGTDVAATATLHGRDLYEQGFSVEQVIRDYGDVCQAVTGLAAEVGAPILAIEFRTFNRCLDDAIAGAVAEYSQLKDAQTTTADTGAINAESGIEDLRQLETELTESRSALADAAAALSIAEQNAREAQVRALHDSLTGLPNRELFDDRLAHAIALADRHDWTLAVMFLDLDQFKSLNDSHGHTAGDAALKTIAQRLLLYVRDEDTVCRNGGDEFLYLLMNPRGNRNIEHIANSVLRTIAQPVSIADQELSIKASIGIATYPEHGANGQQLIAKADEAMYLAKQRSRGVAFFNLPKARASTG